MKAITLTQPWATLMAAGEKSIETRGWSPASLHMAEPVAIHAGKGLGEMDVYQFVHLCKRELFRIALVRAHRRGLIVPQEPGTLMPRDLPRGAVVAVAEF